MPSVKVFISYAHDDGEYFDVFSKGLKNCLTSSANFQFSIWDDSEIPVGSDWHTEIQENLKTAEIAIFCVSDNFFRSEYIISSELNEIINKYPDTLTIPVYFGRCQLNDWKILSKKQFFKPGGKDFGQKENEDFSFCDLAKNDDLNISKYFKDLGKAIEKSYISKKIGNRRLIHARLEDKIVAMVILSVIILSVMWIIFSVITTEREDKIINIPLGGVMFFGSSALFIFNRKSKINQLSL